MDAGFCGRAREVAHLRRFLRKSTAFESMRCFLRLGVWMVTVVVATMVMVRCLSEGRRAYREKQDEGDEKFLHSNECTAFPFASISRYCEESVSVRAAFRGLAYFSGSAVRCICRSTKTCTVSPSANSLGAAPSTLLRIRYPNLMTELRRLSKVVSTKIASS